MDEPAGGTARGGGLYFITGSCGAGKTALLRAVRATLPAGCSARHIDDDGVPDAAQLARAGGPQAWQRRHVRAWAERAVHAAPGDVLVVEGQARPSDIVAAAREVGLRDVHITLVDCAHAERRRRLTEDRRQPELDALDTYAWAAYLRGQADALELEVIDTTACTLEHSAAALAASIARFRAKMQTP